MQIILMKKPEVNVELEILFKKKTSTTAINANMLNLMNQTGFIHKVRVYILKLMSWHTCAWNLWSFSLWFWWSSFPSTNLTSWPFSIWFWWSSPLNLIFRLIRCICMLKLWWRRKLQSVQLCHRNVLKSKRQKQKQKKWKDGETDQLSLTICPFLSSWGNVIITEAFVFPKKFNPRVPSTLWTV